MKAWRRATSTRPSAWSSLVFSWLRSFAIRVTTRRGESSASQRRGITSMRCSLTRPTSGVRPIHISSRIAWQCECATKALILNSIAMSMFEASIFPFPPSVAHTPFFDCSTFRATSTSAMLSSSPHARPSKCSMSSRSWRPSASPRAFSSRSLRQISWPSSAARSGVSVRTQSVFASANEPRMIAHSIRSSADANVRCLA